MGGECRDPGADGRGTNVERQRRLAEVEGRNRVTVQHELFAASFVSIEPDPEPLFEQTRGALSPGTFERFRRLCHPATASEINALIPELAKRRIAVLKLAQRHEFNVRLAVGIADALAAVTRDASRLSGSELNLLHGAVAYFLEIEDEAHNPRLTIEQTIAGPLRYHRLCEPADVRSRCEELMEMVGLSPAILSLRPSRLSGGQRQRVAIARALAVEPEILIADEAVAALDVSVQASILALLNRLREELHLTTVFVSHDLAVIRQVASRVVVLYLGAVVEDRSTDALFDDPQHPYTRALMDAAPKLGLRKEPGSSALAGEVPLRSIGPPGAGFEPAVRWRNRSAPRSSPSCGGPAMRGRPPATLRGRSKNRALRSPRISQREDGPAPAVDDRVPHRLRPGECRSRLLRRGSFAAFARMLAAIIRR